MRGSQEDSPARFAEVTAEQPNVTAFINFIPEISTKKLKIYTDSLYRQDHLQSDKYDAVIGNVSTQEKTVEGIAHSLEVTKKKYHERLKKVSSKDNALKNLKHSPTELEQTVAKKDVEIQEPKTAVDAT